MSIVFSHPCAGAPNAEITAIAPAVGSNMANVVGSPRVNNAGTAARRGVGAGAVTARTNQTLASADYIVRATATFQGTGDGNAGFRLFARHTDTNNHYVLLWFNNNLICRRVLAGANTQLGSTVSWTPTNGVPYVYELIVSGSSISVRRDGVTVSGLGGTDTQFTSALDAAWQIGGTNASDPETTGWILDDLQVELLGAPAGTPFRAYYAHTSG